VVHVVVGDPAVVVRDALVDLLRVRERHVHLLVADWTIGLAGALDVPDVHLQAEALFDLLEVGDVFVLQLFGAHAVEVAAVELVFSGSLGVEVDADLVFLEVNFHFRDVFEFRLGVI